MSVVRRVTMSVVKRVTMSGEKGDHECREG